MTKAKLKSKRQRKVGKKQLIWTFLVLSNFVPKIRYLSDEQHSQEIDTDLQERQLCKASGVNCCFSFSNQP